MTAEEAHDIVAVDGARLGDELARIGYLGHAPSPGLVPHAFVELHIEQGPVLEAEGFTIGAVTGVQGISWTEVTFVGQSNHAGTTPMALRHDAGYAAAATAAFVRQLTGELGPPQVGTVGRIELHPNLVNVVAAARHVDSRPAQHRRRSAGRGRASAGRASSTDLARDEGASGDHPLPRPVRARPLR